MGLDSYLYKKHYVGADYAHNNAKVNIDVTLAGKKLMVNPHRVSTIVEKVARWWNYYPIHDWFVANVQDYEDDCNEHDVCKEQLEELLDTINSILDNKNLAKELLPVNEADDMHPKYTKDYFDMLKDVKEQLDEIINEPDFNDINVYFSYTGGW